MKPTSKIKPKLIIGLGNPGEVYKNNRHNVGHLAIDKAKELKLDLKGFKFSKTDCFMNQSGDFVKRLIQNTNIDLDNLYIIFDDLDIHLGDFKIQQSHGPKDHNGLNDIYQKVRSADFWHVRIGVDNRDRQNRIVGEEYVLQDFDTEEQKLLDSVLTQVCKKLVTL